MKNNETREKEPAYGRDAVEQYNFDYEPIRGYPELRWTGKRPFRGTSYFPAQLKESHGDTVEGWRSKLYWGDNLQVMSHLLREYRGKVRLIYIDPPFDSKADYKKKIELRGMSASSDASAFEEKQYTDIWTNDEYLQFIYERLTVMRELLAEDGSIWVHVDWHKSSELKLILSEVFGYDKFVNEVIWHYKTFQGQLKSYFARKHDNLLLYKKGEKLTYFRQFDTEMEDTMDLTRWNDYFDDDGCIHGNHMPVTDSRFTRYLNAWEKENNREPGESDIVYQLKGQPVDSVWDMKGLDPKSGEKLGYPTQKPESLLERIINASSNPGDLVFDCFMGSGTTQAVAMKLGRRFLGADINLGAIQTTTKRLLGVAEEIKHAPKELALGDTDKPDKLYLGFEVYTVNRYDFFRNELEARQLLIEALELQALPGNMLWDGESEGWMVKILAVNRLATAADLNPILASLDYKAWEKRAKANPEKPVERIRFVCMGHDPELKAQFQNEMDKLGYKVDVEVLDILRDKQELQFKRDSEARISLTKKKLEIKKFYPMNLLQKLSLEKTKVGDWRELVDSILVDWNYDGAVFNPVLVDIPEKNELVKGVYDVPADLGTVRVKITDLLAESWEGNVEA